ncbi:MAG: hypothetical protein KHZ01_05410 [Lachnospiraceae bacterium]|nr:hypothetical protein [Lachnospiraceae bacterium]
MIIIYDTKIKYLKVMDKLYRVADISFYYKTIRAVETGHQIADVPEHVIFEISDFADFKITLVNNNGYFASNEPIFEFYISGGVFVD